MINWIAGKTQAFAALGAMLMGVIVTGLFVAISHDLGRRRLGQCQEVVRGRLIEGRRKHVKGSDAHKAAVTGDTVGDPYKDTAGPAVNPMIKITNIVALLLLAVLGTPRGIGGVARHEGGTWAHRAALTFLAVSSADRRRGFAVICDQTGIPSSHRCHVPRVTDAQVSGG